MGVKRKNRLTKIFKRFDKLMKSGRLTKVAARLKGNKMARMYKKRKNGKKKKNGNGNGLTAKQRKLPPALQRSILRKKRGKKK